MIEVCPQCRTAYDPAATGGPCPRCSLAGALAGTPAAAPTEDYEFVAELGRGGMGVVSLARQRSLDRLVALKVIAAAVEAGTGPDRLLREARAAAAITHPNVVAVHEVGQGQAGAFIAMEYCEGGDLRARLRPGPLPPRAAAELVRKLADAVARAHAAGILHRDLKPSNVLLTAAGEPKLSDFGLSGSITSLEATRPGSVAGSPAYLAPEALQPDLRPNASQDVYGLGALLYECATGRPPFLGESAATVLAQVAQAEPPPPRLLNRGIPRDLETIILKCLEKKPAARYATAAALRDDLDRLLAGHPIHARPVSSAGRAWRWARRHPARATAAGAALLLILTVAIGSSLAALRLERERAHTAAERDRATQAEAATREQLRAALIAQARATRLTAREGHRRDALEVLRRAAAIRPGLDARDEAVAALALPEWTPHQLRPAWNDPGASTATPLPGFKAFIHESEAGVFSRRTFPEGRIEWTWPGAGAASAGQTIVSPDGRWCAVRLQNDEIHVLDAVTGQPVFALAGRPFTFKESRIWGYCLDMAFSPDGARFAATRAEGGLTVHAMPGGEQVAAWEDPARLVSLAWSPNGRWLAAGGSRQRELNTIVLLDAATARPLARDTAVSRVDFLAWSANSRWLAVGSRPVQVRATEDFSIRAVVPDRAALYGHFLPGDDLLLLTEQTGQTRLWDIDAGRQVMFKQDSGRPGAWFEGDPVSQWRYFTAGNVEVQTLEPSPILTVHRPEKSGYTTPSIADPLDLSPDGRWLIVGGWRRPRLVEIATGRTFALGDPGPEGSAAVGRLEADGRTLWIGQSGGPLRRHELTFARDGQPIVSEGEIVPGHNGFLPTALHRGTGLLALTHFRTGLVRILDVHSREAKAEWALPKASHATFSPDGKWVLSNAEPTPTGRAEVREAATGRVVFAPGPKSGRVGAWSPDGRWLLVGVDRDQTGLWRTDSWQPGRALPPNLQSYNLPGAFSPDGRWLVIRMDTELHWLRADTLELVARLEIPNTTYLCALRFTDDSRTLVAVRADGRIDLWHLAALRAELAKLGLDWKD